MQPTGEQYRDTSLFCFYKCGHLQRDGQNSFVNVIGMQNLLQSKLLVLYKIAYLFAHVIQIWSLNYFNFNNLVQSSRGGLEVELWTDNNLPSASVDQIPLGAMYLYGTIWTRYIYKVYRHVIYT